MVDFRSPLHGKKTSRATKTSSTGLTLNRSGLSITEERVRRKVAIAGNLESIDSLSDFEPESFLTTSHNSVGNLINRIPLSYPLADLHSDRVACFSLFNVYIINLH